MANSGKEFIAGFGFNADLSTGRVVQSEEIAKLPAPNRPVGAPYLQALKKPQAHDQGLRTCDIEVKSVRDRLRISENEKSLERQVQSLEQENQTLKQQLKAKDFDSMMKCRELFNCFRSSKPGGTIDKLLMNWAREQARKLHFQDCYSSGEYFSSQVIHLKNQQITLTNDLKGKSPPSDCQRQLKAVTRKLYKLREAAKTFKTREMAWDSDIGQGIFDWCLLVAEANKKCHYDMSIDFRNAMRCHAEKGECKFEGLDFRSAVVAVCEKLDEEERNKR